MKKLLAILSLTLLLILFQFLVEWTWWAFAIPSFVIGVLLPPKSWKRPAFLIGFIAGFASWTIPYLYFEAIFDGQIMEVVASLFSLSSSLVVLLSGAIGGGIAGLGFYSGALMRAGKETLDLDLAN
jgi:uncharacterized membrane protein